MRLALAAAAVLGALAAPTAVAAPAACHTGDLRLAFAGSEGAAGTMFEKLRLAPRPGVSCTLRGYPGVALLGRRGRVKPVHVARIHDDLHPVRTLAFTRRRPARFDVRHPSFDPRTTRTCGLRVYAIRVIPPGETSSLTVRVGRTPLRFCRAGARVTPVGRRY